MKTYVQVALILLYLVPNRLRTSNIDSNSKLKHVSLLAICFINQPDQLVVPIYI
jgi:type III secretory pathway component EscR